MYARVITFQPHPGKLDALIEMGTNTVAPLMQQQPDCQLVTILSDPVANKAIVVGFWKSKLALLATEQNSFYQEQITKTQPLLAAAPIYEVYAVNLQTAPI